MNSERNDIENQFQLIVKKIKDEKVLQENLGGKLEIFYLTPSETRVVQCELNCQLAEGRLVHTSKNTDALISGNIDGLEILGIKIKTDEIKSQ